MRFDGGINLLFHCGVVCGRTLNEPKVEENWLEP